MALSSRVLLSTIVTTASFLLIPSSVVMAQLRSYAFIPNLHSNNVTVISSPGNTVVATINVGASPTAVAVTPDGRRAYVVNENSNSVSVIDTSTLTVAATIPVGSFPVGIAITPDGSKAFVANSFSDSIDVIDTATNTVVASLTPPGLDAPRAIAISPDGSTAYVTSQANGYVFPVDVATHAVDLPISVGQWPVAVAFTEDGTRAFVANYLSNSVSVINVSSQTLITQFPANSPSSVAVSPDGEYVYIANYLTNQVTVLEPFSLTLFATISGFADPSGVAFTPDGRRLHVLNAATNSVAVLSIPSYLLVDNIPVGTTPASYTSTFIGPTTIIPSGGAFNVFGDGTLAAEGFDRFIVFGGGGTLRAMADLNITRPVSLLGTDGGTIDTNGFNVTLAGNVINDGALTKTGGGTLTLTGTSTHAVGTTIGPGGGTLVIDGIHTSPSVLVTGGTFGGSGTLGAVTTGGGIINPGAAAPGSTGILHASNVSLNALAALSIDIKGTTPGTGYDRLEASGAVLLNGASLGVFVSSFSTTPGQTFTILTNATGTFGGLPEGTVLASLNHTDFFSISYVGGGGHDVVLTALEKAPFLNGLTTITVNEDSGVVSVPITVGHVFYGAPSIVVTPLPPTNLALVPTANVTVVGTGASRTIQITPRGNAFGTTQINVQAEVNGHSTSQSFTLQVNAVNDPPSISAIGAQSVPENTPLAPVGFTVSDIDTDAAALTVTASSSNQAVVPDTNLTIGGGSGATRTIAAMPRTAVRGETIITVTVSDGTESVSTSFTLTVTEGTYYLAEGATGAFFDTDILLANPNETPAPVVITFLTTSGQSIVQTRTLPGTSRTTIHAEDIAGLEATMFSTIVTSTDALPLVVERTMRWDASGYGAHTEKATAGAAPTWYFAEGSTGFFSTFLLLANPHAAANTAHVTWFREGEPELARDYPLAPGSRTTIDAWDEPELRNRSFGARVTFDLPGVAERAMYFGADPLWVGGHAAAGTTTPWATWFFAEGATGSYFSTFLLLANPNDVPTDVTLTYYPESGIPVTKTDTIPARQRMTRNIALEDPSLANAAVATRVQSAWPIVAERSQYWGAPTWIEAHNSPGVAEVGTRWGLAEGRVGGSDDAQTYILLANPNVGLDPASVTITFLRADGTTIVKTFSVPSTSRVNVAVVPGEGNMVPELIDESFGARIESTLRIVVERSVYSRANGVTWAAGTNATATRLP